MVTNTPELLLESTLLTTTNLAGGEWLPWKTNHMLICPTDGVRYFKTGNLNLIPTNILTL